MVRHRVMRLSMYVYICVYVCMCVYISICAACSALHLLMLQKTGYAMIAINFVRIYLEIKFNSIQLILYTSR